MHRCYWRILQCLKKAEYTFYKQDIEANQIFQSQNHLRLTDCNSIISDLGYKKRSGHVLH